MKSKWFKTTLKIINAILMVGVFYFAYVYGESLIKKADFSGLQQNWWILVLAFLCFLVFYLVFSYHWLKVCRIINPGTESKQGLSYLASQPFKYLPTSIFSFSFRAKYTKMLGMPVKNSTYAQLLENLNILGSGTIMSAVLLAFTKSFALGALLFLASVLVILIIIRLKLKITVPLTAGKRRLHVYKLVPSFIVASFGWVVAGTAFWLVNVSLNYSLNPVLAIGANAAGFVVSILAVFAPGGVGVRELTLSLLSIQNSAIVMWRLLTFAADMIVGLSVVLYITIKKRGIGYYINLAKLQRRDR